MISPRLSIFARLPEPGKVKTRLIPALGAEAATAVYEALLLHTLEVARSSTLDFEVRVTGGDPDAFRERFGSDLCVAPQGNGDLGARMTAVGPPSLIIGSDCPGLGVSILQSAAKALESHRIVLGPATDGGYYLIGLRDRMPWLFENMAWSTAEVFAETRRRSAERGIDPAILPELADIDTPEDLAQWPAFR